MTDADHFIGPAAVDRFRGAGDDVVARPEPFTSRGDVEAFVDRHGPFSVVVANLDVPISVASITDHDDDIVSDAFGRVVRPLFWLFEVCLPSMVEAGTGAVVVPTSATAIRSSAHPIAAYQAARAAQVSLVHSVGREMARHGVRVNGIAPNYIENPSYFPPETVADARFQQALQRDVPAQRLGRGAEAAEVLHWLASDGAGYLFGAVIPTDGGWSL